VRPKIRFRGDQKSFGVTTIMMIVASMILAVLATANTYDAPGSSAAELVASGTFNWESSPLATSRLDSVQLGTTPTAPSRFAAEGAGDATEAPAEDAASDDDCPVGAPPQSFTPTTRVELASGAFVPISSIKVGDKVLATDPTSGKTTAETVTATNIHGDNDLMDLVVHTRTGNQTIHTTDLHPVWDVTTGSWTLVEDLKSGDVLRSYDGHLSTVANTIQLSGSRDMWDLTVTTDHDFYVVVGAGTGVLVHNVDGDCTPSTQDSWGNPSTLARHFVDHSADFGASTENEYALQASRFIQRSQAEGLPTKIADNGVIRAYDPSTNEFGSFNADGTTKTYFAPDPKSHGFPTNWDYWVSQPGDEPWTP